MNGHAVGVCRGDTLVRVPVSATDLYPDLPRPPTSKLSLQAIRDLVRLAALGERTIPAVIVGPPTVEQVADGAGVSPPASPHATGGEP